MLKVKSLGHAAFSVVVDGLGHDAFFSTCTLRLRWFTETVPYQHENFDVSAIDVSLANEDNTCLATRSISFIYCTRISIIRLIQ